MLKVLDEHYPSELDNIQLAAWLGVSVARVQSNPPKVLRAIKLIDQRKFGSAHKFFYKANIKNYFSFRFDVFRPKFTDKDLLFFLTDFRAWLDQEIKKRI